MGNAFYCLAGKMVGCFGCNATNRHFVLPYPSQPIPGKGHVHQRQLAVGTLFNSQQRRALAVPRLNRWSTAGFVPPPVYLGFFPDMPCMKRVYRDK